MSIYHKGCGDDWRNVFLTQRHHQPHERADELEDGVLDVHLERPENGALWVLEVRHLVTRSADDGERVGVEGIFWVVCKDNDRPVLAFLFSHFE